MEISVSNTITIYEIIAIAIAILIPLGKWIITSFFIRTRVRFIPNGFIDLWFNQSGSYFQINGVYEACQKSTNIERISASIERKGDGAKLNHEWYHFVSPTNPSMLGASIQTTEIAHPIRLEKDSVTCVFIRFCDPFDSDGKEFKVNTESLFARIPEIQQKHTKYTDALAAYKQLPEYIKERRAWENKLYWRIGQYKATITVRYGKNKVKEFAYSFSINEHDASAMLLNVDESLISPLKSRYNVNWNYQNASIQLNEIKH